MTERQLVMDVKVERGSKSDARLQPGAEPGGEGGVLFDSLRPVYFTDGLFY